MQSQSHSPARLLQITPWEQRALQLLADGETPTQVALRLGVSSLEGDVLLTRLFAAMGVTTRADAVAGARRRGLLVPLVTHTALDSIQP
jgi:DNA-binding CsgD family transcriptional regulator